MAKPEEIYVNCDVLEKIPKIMQENWLFELDFLSKHLPKNATILQIGSMDGTRILRLLKIRPDLQITGLEIEQGFVTLARKNIANAGLNATFIHGDITNPPKLPLFDYVLCLNHTLGYIPDQKKALYAMQQLGKETIISVYGEKFDEKLANKYFASINLKLEKVENDFFIFKDFTRVRRYTKKEVLAFGGTVLETPVGYLCILKQ